MFITPGSEILAWLDYFGKAAPYQAQICDVRATYIHAPVNLTRPDHVAELPQSILPQLCRRTTTLSNHTAVHYLHVGPLTCTSDRLELARSCVRVGMALASARLKATAVCREATTVRSCSTFMPAPTPSPAEVQT